jgi:hypothetical protein
MHRNCSNGIAIRGRYWQSGPPAAILLRGNPESRCSELLDTPLARLRSRIRYFVLPVMALENCPITVEKSWSSAAYTSLADGSALVAMISHTIEK